MTPPKLSLVLCARNDSYQGNAVWRLNTALNFVADRAEASGHASALEVLVVDWGSDSPLSETVKISPVASGVTSFLWVPPDTARALQRDSPFAEVLALNAGIRRARGEYVGRIDQDTLVGGRFLGWFFEEFAARRSGIPTDAILLSNRRSIPYRFAAQCPSFSAVQRFVERSGPSLSLSWIQPDHLYYRSPIGLLLMHRELWHASQGYDETMIYFNYMEWDLVLRLKTRFPFVNLGRLVDHDFFHLDHEHPFGRWAPGRKVRKMNPERDEVVNVPPAFAPNGPDWGLATDPTLASADAHPSRDWRSAGGSRAGESRLSYAALWTRYKVRKGLDAAVLFLPAPVKRRFMEARSAVEQEALHRWPGLLLAHVRRSSTVASRATE